MHKWATAMASRVLESVLGSPILVTWTSCSSCCSTPRCSTGSSGVGRRRAARRPLRGGPRRRPAPTDDRPRERSPQGAPQLARLERERRSGRLSFPDFRRRYARLAGREPAEDPRREGPYGPSTPAIAGFLDRVAAMAAGDWDLAEEHLSNLQAN